MFEESLLESAHLIPSQSRWTGVAALALQATIAATIIAIPLLHPSVVALHAPLLQLIAPPLTPPSTPPPVQRVHVDASAASAVATTAPVVEASLNRPRLLPGLDPNHSSDTPPAIGNIGTMAGPGTSLDATLMASAVGTRAVIAVKAKPGPLHISTGVSAGMLLSPIQPIYPPIARAAHVEGTVIVHAIISKAGRIESAAATSGPMMLQGAALDAVRAARYRPYQLNGQPTEVDTTFSIIFHLSS